MQIGSQAAFGKVCSTGGALDISRWWSASATTGKRAQPPARRTSRVRQHQGLSGVPELFVQTVDGELMAARHSREKFAIVRRYQVAESATRAEPILFDRHVLVKDANSLRLWSLR